MPIFSSPGTTTQPVITTTTTNPVFSNCGMSVRVYSLDNSTLCFDITGGTAPYDFYVDSVQIGSSNTDGVTCFAIDCTVTHTFSVIDSTPPCEEILNQNILANTGFTSTSDWFIDTPGGGGTAAINGGYFTYSNIQVPNSDSAVAAYQSYPTLLPNTPISVTYFYEFTTGQVSGLTYGNVYFLTPWSSNTPIIGPVSPSTYYSATQTLLTDQSYIYGYGVVLHASTPIPNINDNIFELDSFNIRIISYTYDCRCTVSGDTQIYVPPTTNCNLTVETYWSGSSICFSINGGTAPYDIYIDNVLIDTVNSTGIFCYPEDFTVTHTYQVTDSTPPCEVTLNQFILTNTGFTSTSDWIINGGGADAFISGGNFIITGTTYNTFLSSTAIQDYVLPNNVIPISVNYYWEFNSGNILTQNRNYNQIVLVTPFNGTVSVYLEGSFPGVVPNTFYSGITTVNTFTQVYPPTPLSGYGFGVYSSLLQDNYFELQDFNLQILSYTYDCTCTITGQTQIPCDCYLIENQNGSNSDYSAYDCNGVYYTGTVLSAQFISICGYNVETLPGSLPLNITVNGQCDGNLNCIPNCYIVFNSGYTGCEVIYVDYSGNTQTYLLPSGELFQVCSLVQPAATGILCARTLVVTQTGICSGDTCPTACNCYFIENPSETTDVDFIALDCNGDFYSGTVLAGQFVTLCGSNVQSTSLPLNITVNGLCDVSGNCVANCWLVYNTGQTNCQFYYIDYSGNIQTEVISPSFNGVQICSLVQPEGVGRICSQDVYSVLIGDCVGDVCFFPTTTTTSTIQVCTYTYVDCSGNTLTGTVVEGEVIYVCSSGAPQMVECFLNINYLGSCENTPNCVVTTTTTLEPACYCYLIGISSTTSSTTPPPNSTTTSSTAGNSTTTSSTAPTTTIPPAACSNCKYVDLLISNVDLTDANNYATVVEFQYIDCNGNEQTNYYGYETGDITDTVCVCLDTTTKLVYYDDQFTEYIATNSTATPTLSGCPQTLIFTSSLNSCTYTGVDCNGISFSGVINSGEQIYVCSRTQPQSTECSLDIIDKGLCGGVDCLVVTTTQPITTTTTIPCICYTIDYDLGNSICAIEYINCSGTIVTEDIGVLSSTGQTLVCSQNEPVYSCSIEDGLNYINIINSGTNCVNGQCVVSTTTTQPTTTTTQPTTTTTQPTTTTTSNGILCDCVYIRNDDISPCFISYVPCSGGTTQNISVGVGQTINLCVQNYNPPIDCTLYIRNVGSCTSECTPPNLDCYSVTNTIQTDCNIDYISDNGSLVTLTIPAGSTVPYNCGSYPISSDCTIGIEVLVNVTGACVLGQCTQI